MQESRPSQIEVVVQVLYAEGCPHTPGAIELIKDVALEMGVQICLSETLIESVEQAEEMRFLGSPTVLVSGLDIDPAARNSTSYGFM